MTNEEMAQKYFRFALRNVSMDGKQELKYLTELFDEHAQDAINEYERKRWEECYREFEK